MLKCCNQDEITKILAEYTKRMLAEYTELGTLLDFSFLSKDSIISIFDRSAKQMNYLDIAEIDKIITECISDETKKVIYAILNSD